MEWIVSTFPTFNFSIHFSFLRISLTTSTQLYSTLFIFLSLWIFSSPSSCSYHSDGISMLKWELRILDWMSRYWASHTFTTISHNQHSFKYSNHASDDMLHFTKKRIREWSMVVQLNLYELIYRQNNWKDRIQNTYEIKTDIEIVRIEYIWIYLLAGQRIGKSTSVPYVVPNRRPNSSQRMCQLHKNGTFSSNIKFIINHEYLENVYFYS